MAELIKPGIFINEFDKSSYITEGPTTITGVVGTSPKGASNEVVLMTSYSNFVTEFGQDSGYLDFFARFFFKYGGNKLLVVRATDGYYFAGITNGLESIYEIKSTLASSDETLHLQYVSGATIASAYNYWPASGLVRLDYAGESEYIDYREIDIISAGDVHLLGCHRAVNGSTAITIATTGISVTPVILTSLFDATTAHGLVNGQKVRFTGIGGGVVVTTDYWVINKTSTTFQITATNGGTVPFVVANATVNTVQPYPVPTKYVHVVAPVVSCEIGATTNWPLLPLTDMDYGKFNVGDVIHFDGTPIAPNTTTEYVVRTVNVAFNETARTQTIIVLDPGSLGVPTGLVSGDRASLVPDPFYGGLGLNSLAKYMNYDAWGQAKVDENGYTVKGADISDPTEFPIFMQIYARSCGAWANDDLRVTVYTHAAWDSTTTIPYFKNKVNYTPTTNDELLVIVESVTTGNIEESWLVSLIPTKVDFWGKTMFISDLINDNSKWIRVFVNPSYLAVTGSGFNTPTSVTWLPHSFERYYLAGGTNGGTGVLGVLSTPNVREFKIMAGYNLFANPNEVDIDLISAGGNQSLAVQANIKSIAETRKDCVGILNIPWGLTITDAVRYKILLGSSTYSAIYCNGSKVLDSFTGSIVSLPPAIQVTPLIVKTDLTRDPWFAAAGYNRGMLNEVIELEQEITDGEFETLYSAGINPIINDGNGPVVFGIKTMYTGSSAFNKLTVRRLMLKMEKDIKNSMKAFLFEPNTFDTRLRIIRTVEPYLGSIRARDGIEDFRVICDSTNNTSQTIAAGQIICDIYIKPVFAAEYIIFNFTVTKDEISSIISNT